MVVYTEDDMSRIKEQAVVLWNQKCEGMKLIGIRFDQSPVDSDEDEYPSIAFIWSENDNPGYYFIAWGECHYGTGGFLVFTEDDLESWSESGESPWEGELGGYVRLVTDVYPDHPEWVHVYL